LCNFSYYSKLRVIAGDGLSAFGDRGLTTRTRLSIFQRFTAARHSFGFKAGWMKRAEVQNA
jgi:hypothetical protein